MADYLATCFAAVSICPAAYDQETGRARGFAHVEFAESAAAAAAAAKNGEVELDGRTLRLDLSAGRSGGAGTPGGNRGGQQTDGTTIFVKGFDTSGEAALLLVGCRTAMAFGCRTAMAFGVLECRGAAHVDGFAHQTGCLPASESACGGLAQLMVVSLQCAQDAVQSRLPDPQRMS